MGSLGKKRCSKCNLEKDRKDFPKSSRYKDGLYPSCKVCHNAKSMESVRNKDGIIPQIYSTQRRNSLKRGHALPSYTQMWLKDWLFSNPEFHRLYDMWVLSGYQREFKPSVDRIDDNLGYTEYNIQLLSWRENAEKQYNKRKE